MLQDRVQSAQWLELSGLPAELNKVRANGWLVFKTLVEMDCRAHRQPEAVEASLEELARRCGLDWERVGKILEALCKKKALACFVPDNPDEEGLYQIRVPVKTPKSAEETALEATDPQLRDASLFRYVDEEEDSDEMMKKTQKIVDVYLNKLSHKVNSFIVGEIEILARRFPMDKIELTMDRAARHEIRSIGWVVKELIRDSRKPPKDQATAR